MTRKRFFVMKSHAQLTIKFINIIFVVAMRKCSVAASAGIC